MHMTKVLTINIIIFLAVGCNRHLLSETELKSRHGYNDITEALENSKDVYSLNLHMPDSLSREILKFTRLNELDIYKPKFNSLPNFIGRFKNLQTLIILDGKISFLPAEIGKLKNLKWLRLWNLNLTELPTQIDRLRKLETLELFANNLKQLPSEITELRHLKKIGIDNNDSLDFYDSFKKLAQLPNLTYLNLNYYPHDTLPGNINTLQGLETITLWNNKSGRLDLKDTIEKLSELKKLIKIDLSGTPVDKKLKFEYVEMLKKQHSGCEIIWNDN
jgi:Leucine-rich repeat (LRR) protein